MRARALFAGMAAALAVALAAGPAAAKGAIAEANISGPGLGGGSGVGIGGGGIRIEAPDTDRMWEAGIMDDKPDSLSAFGLTPADLGPRYLVSYRFDFGPGTQDDIVRQELYPYAKDGPVTYTQPGQRLTNENENMNALISSGWWQANPGFLDFLVENGLPASAPVAAKAAPRSQPAPATTPVQGSLAWVWILVGVAGVAAALSLAAPPLRRRVLALVHMNH